MLIPILEDSSVREILAGKAGASSELFTGAGGLEGWSSCSQHGSEGLHRAVCTRRVWFSLWLLRMHTELMGPWRRLCPAEAGAALSWPCLAAHPHPQKRAVEYRVDCSPCSHVLRAFPCCVSSMGGWQPSFSSLQLREFGQPLPSLGLPWWLSW